MSGDTTTFTSSFEYHSTTSEEYSTTDQETYEVSYSDEYVDNRIKNRCSGTYNCQCYRDWRLYHSSLRTSILGIITAIIVISLLYVNYNRHYDQFNVVEASCNITSHEYYLDSDAKAYSIKFNFTVTYLSNTLTGNQQVFGAAPNILKFETGNEVKCWVDPDDLMILFKLSFSYIVSILLYC
eukprot:TRINITY_DN3681_c0_g4_i2.p1 TRINITY_DN3681_c0_g4~~TRINITY_DN3681_c0_g4_i2.p1  ORF type:complete len:182 (+),score=17.16 TRINITY_DN3681_c0_g4_i2:34-579(+)